VYSRGEENYSPSPYHCSWNITLISIPTVYVRRCNPEAKGIIPLLHATVYEINYT